jgi:transcriptional regulator with XRE-family HTH domain
MTKVKDTKQTFAEFASQMARNPETLAQFTELMSDATRKREIGRRIKEERERRGLKQPQVAERAGVSGSPTNALRKYQNWEAGANLPDHEQLERIADALGVSYDYLVTGGDEAPPAKDILKRLDRIEQQLAVLLDWTEGRTVAEVEAALAKDAKKKRPPKSGTGH